MMRRPKRNMGQLEDRTILASEGAERRNCEAKIRRNIQERKIRNLELYEKGREKSSEGKIAPCRGKGRKTS